MNTDVKDPCHKAGWEKVKAVKNTEKQGEYKSDMGTEMIVSILKWIQNVINADQCQNEKRQIIYEHNLPVRLEHTVGVRGKKSRCSPGVKLEIPFWWSQ
ncbi:MAG: hypothetical protein V8Q57_03705 [Blautia sp.]